MAKNVHSEGKIQPLETRHEKSPTGVRQSPAKHSMAISLRVNRRICSFYLENALPESVPSPLLRSGRK